MLPQESCLQASERDNSGSKRTLLFWYVRHDYALLVNSIMVSYCFNAFSRIKLQIMESTDYLYF